MRMCVWEGQFESGCWKLRVWQSGSNTELESEGLGIRKSTLWKVLPTIIDPVMADRTDAALSPRANLSNNSIFSPNVITSLCLLAQRTLSITLHLGSLKMMREKHYKVRNGRKSFKHGRQMRTHLSSKRNPAIVKSELNRLPMIFEGFLEFVQLFIQQIILYWRINQSLLTISVFLFLLICFLSIIWSITICFCADAKSWNQTIYWIHHHES